MVSLWFQGAADVVPGNEVLQRDGDRIVEMAGLERARHGRVVGWAAGPRAGRRAVLRLTNSSLLPRMWILECRWRDPVSEHIQPRQ